MRALLLGPDVILLDEPLGALDPMIRSELQNDLRRIFQTLRKTVVMVTHELDIALYTKRNIIMRDGVVVNDVAVQNRALAEVELRTLDQAHQAVKLSS